MDAILLTLILNVTFGAIAGGVTNAVAVWMLFHPYERRFGLHGAIPKNKARLAKSIGRTVGERLLTPADIAGELSRGGIRESFDAKLIELITALLETERGSLRDMLPAEVFAEVERALTSASPLVADRAAGFLESEEFEERVVQFVAKARADLAPRPLGTVLTPARRTEIRDRASRWAAELSASSELEQGVREYLEKHALDLVSAPEPMLERIPAPLVEALERAIQSYLPLAVEKVGTFLGEPASRERIRTALHDIFARFVEDLRFHERVIARLMVTERTFDKVLDSMEREGVEQLVALLEDPLVRDEISRTINSAIVEYLRKPLREVVGDPDSQRVQDIVQVAGDYVLRAVRAEQTHGFLGDKLDAVLERAEGRTFGDILGAFDDRTIAGWIVQGARTERVNDWIEQSVRLAIAGALVRPIGRPGRWLPPDAAPRLASVVGPALWSWIQTQLPALTQRLDVEAMVERKVLGFSVERMEEIIRRVTQRELDLIVYLGWLLGAFIGLVSFLTGMVTRGL
jgi:uncharacterized membrane-anchored protein YjiN (DUF445 family)